MSVHSNVYDPKVSNVPMRVPLYTKQSTCGVPATAAASENNTRERRSAERSPKPILFRARDSPSPERFEKRILRVVFPNVSMNCGHKDGKVTLLKPSVVPGDLFEVTVGVLVTITEANFIWVFNSFM
jgi:hypothetical protein